MVELIARRGLVEPRRGLGGAAQIVGAVLVGIALRPVDELARLDGLELHAEDAHELAVQRAAEAEALRRVADGGQLERAHALFELRRGEICLDAAHDGLFLRRAEAVGKALPAEGAHGVGGGVGAGEGVEAQAAAVDDGLAQRPEQDGAVRPAQQFGHIGGVGKGQVLEDDEIGLQALEIGAQRVEREQHILRADDGRLRGAEHGDGALKLLACALEMKGRHADRDIDSGKSVHDDTPVRQKMRKMIAGSS